MSRKQFTINSFVKKNSKTTFQSQEEWIQSGSTNRNTNGKSLKLTDSNFPSRGGVVSTKENDSKIKYDLKQLFNKKKNKKKKEIEPGWIRLYYKNNVKCIAYGPQEDCGYDSETKYQVGLIQEMIDRHELYEYLDELSNYTPYWKLEDRTPEESLDYYPGDTESEEEYDEEEEETDEEDDYDY